MNDKGGVSAATRDRVLRAAEKLGYVPTQAARRLVLQRTGNIGFVVREDHFTRSEPFYTRIFLGTEFEARLHSYYVLLTTIPTRYSSGDHIPRFLRERNVDGVLVAGKVADEFIHEVQDLDVPVVLIDFEVDNVPSVVIDNQGGARAAVEHLIARGHERIAFLGAEMDHPGLYSRLEGYRLALAANDMPARTEWIVTSEDATPTFKTGADLTEHLLSLDPRPSAVFCVNDAMALGVMEKGRQMGLQIPDDLAVVGFDDVPAASNVFPALTTVRVFKEQLGELALRTLVDLIDGNTDALRSYARINHSVKLTTELVVRESS